MASKKKNPKKAATKGSSRHRKRPPRRVNRRPWLTAVIFFVLGIIMATVVIFFVQPESTPPLWQRLRRQLEALKSSPPATGKHSKAKKPATATGEKSSSKKSRKLTAANQQLTLTIYQASQDYAELVKWQQKISGHPTRRQLARKIFALLNRDSYRGKSPLPPGVQLRRVLFEDKVITVDLSPEIVNGLAHSGSTDEMLAVYGLVNSFLANFPAYHRVQLTVNGRVIPTLAGHIEILQPLAFWPERQP